MVEEPEQIDEYLQDDALAQPQDINIEDIPMAVNDLRLNFNRLHSKCLCHPKLQK
jgi:hypothetical protein